MKYVRTKDGKIYNKSKIICSAFREEYCSPNWNEDIEKYLQTKIVAEADTIEELCDEFVCDHNNGTRVIQIKECKPQFPLCEDTIDYFIRNNQTFYGAIWTNKGLIYVAKTNENGELELL